MVFESPRTASHIPGRRRVLARSRRAGCSQIGAIDGLTGKRKVDHVDFGFSEEQEMLRQSARALLEKECPSTVVRKLMEDESGFDPALWKKMAELGWLGLVIPEQYSGGGLSYVDLVLIMEEMGRVVLPSPFIWTVMVAEAIKRVGNNNHKSSLLPKIAAGELIATVAYLEPAAAWSPDGIAMTAPGAAIRSLKNGGDFFLREIRNRHAVKALDGNGKAVAD